MQGNSTNSHKKDIRVIVCLPAYNEAKSISKVILKAKKFASEIVVYDDGSDDNTAEIAAALGATVIRSVVNKGYGVAIRELFFISKHRDADIMITIDSDGQHDPDQIPDIIRPILTNGFDIAIGSRFLNRYDQERVPLYRRLGIQLITKLTKAVSYNNITDAQNCFRAYSRKALAELDLRQDGWSASIEILLKAKERNLSIAEIPITVYYNVESSSTHNSFFHGMGLLISLIQFMFLRRHLIFYGILILLLI